MCESHPGIDLGFRPAGYFWPLDLATHLLATVKGAERRKHIQSLVDSGQLALLEDYFARSGLTPEERSAQGRIHPLLMGGEYLPDLAKGEVEIARITLASTTQDVVSVRARRQGSRIAYRLVDEYGGSTLEGPWSRTSVRPLTLGQLVNFIEGAYSLYQVMEANELLDDAENMASFAAVTSPFYPTLEGYYVERFQDWEQENLDDDEESEVEEEDRD